MTTQIDVFLDYVCPFCFLIEDAIDEVKQDRDAEVRIRPFELRPDPVPTLRPEDDYLPRVWKASVYPMAERLGVDVTLPTVSPQPRTERAFVVLQLAQEHDVVEHYSKAMFKAFFQQDRNIGEDEVIIDVAVSAGLEASAVQAALADQARHERQKADQDFAVNAVGVTAAPSILVNGELVPGVPSATRLKKIIDASAEEATASKVLP